MFLSLSSPLLNSSRRVYRYLEAQLCEQAVFNESNANSKTSMFQVRDRQKAYYDNLRELYQLFTLRILPTIPTIRTSFLR